jgi:hypothetical protein
MTPGRALALLLGCLAGGIPCLAQPFTQLSGMILDPSEAGVPGAAVSLVNEDSGFRRAVESQPDGSYRVAPLEPGLYKITVRKEGFRTVVRFGLRLETRQAARANFTLPVGSMQETITVEGEPDALSRAEVSPGAVLARGEFEDLPLNGRGLLSLLDLAPGTVITPATRGESGQFTVDGQRPNTHYFTVDGVSANTGVSAGGLPAQSTGGVLPAMSAFGSMHSLVSFGELAELRVQTSTTAPDFGRLPGANVALTSRSGSNQFHGSLLYSFRHEDLAANDWFANRGGNPRAPLRLSDAGAALGGPLLRNRTFFYLSYEGLRLRQPFAWRSVVPSLAAREAAPDWVQPVLGSFPVPNGPALGPDMGEWSGRNNRPSRLDVGSLRIDHAFTPRVTAFGRYNVSPSVSEFGNTQVNHLDLRWRSVTAGLSVRPRPDLVLDLRANASTVRVNSYWQQMGEAASAPCYLDSVMLALVHSSGRCGYLLRLSVAGLGQFISGSEGAREQGQYQLVAVAGLTRGGHSFQMTADYRRLSPRRRDGAGSIGAIAESLSDLNADHNLWLAVAGPQNSSTVLREYSASLRDTWRITPRLTATYGLRWDFSPAPGAGRDAYYLDPIQGTMRVYQRPIWPAQYRNLAPRVGVAWRPGEGRTVVRAGGGIYYGSSLSIATDLINGGPFSLWQYANGKYAPFSMVLSYGFMPDLRLPLVKQWNVSVEHSLGGREVISATYAGSAGRRLIRREMGGPGATPVSWIALATNNGSATYHGLQVQYRRSLARGLRGLASYSWSHSIDDGSSDAGLYWAGPQAPRRSDRGSSDFDVRQAFSTALNYEFRGWALDGIFHARAGFPLTVQTTEHFNGLTFANVFRPNLVPGRPIWIDDPAAPGGRRLDPGAFAIPPTEVQGSLGRNVITGFGMSQLDLALRRAILVREERSIELRLEAFNALNHANFADPVKYLVNPLFGQSTSMLNLMLGSGSPASGLAPMFQTGGARSLQITLRLRF